MRALAVGLSITAWTLWICSLGTQLRSLWTDRRWGESTVWLLLSAAIVFALSSMAAAAAGDWARAISQRRTGWIVIAMLAVWALGEAWQDRRERRERRSRPPRDNDEEE